MLMLMCRWTVMVNCDGDGAVGVCAIADVCVDAAVYGDVYVGVGDVVDVYV